MTSLVADARHGRRIARVEVRRSVRGYFQQRSAKLGLAALVLIFGSVFVFGVLPAAYGVGRVVSTESQFPLLDALRQQTTSVVGTLLVIFALRTVERLSNVDNEELLLTTTSSRAVVFGLLLAEVTRLCLWFGPPLLLALGAFCLGAGTPLFAVSTLLALAPLVAFAAVFGYLLGICALYASRYVPLPSSLKTVAYPLLIGVVIVASQILPRLYLSGSLPFTLDPLFDLLDASPFAAYGEFFLLGTPVARPVSPVAVAVLGALLAAVPVGLTVTARVVDRFWTTDAAVTDGTGSEGTVEATPTRTPRPFAFSKAGRIGWHYLRQGGRSPRRFVHLFFVLFMLAPVASSVVESPDLLYLVAIAGSVVLGAFLSGSAFGLNPFGDDQAVLPLLLVTATPPRAFVRGRLVAGLAIGLPFVVLGPLVVALVGPQTLLEAVVYASFGLLLAVASATWGVGLGTAVPKFESRTMYGVETVTPSLLVLFGYNALVGLTGVLGLVLLGVALSEGVATSPLVIGVGAVAAAVLLATALGSYVYAVRRFRSYTLD
ncbi:hypothetical protein ACFPYI_04245 [Halomarina salina]|uniref:ABC-2 type transport system permease protein n=1 Tax=Halomarina salina TaxID=1872699 RepID=A0ABD5RK24_9EURY|nr:hypothetical protein [Halomarina salina]